MYIYLMSRIRFYVCTYILCSVSEMSNVMLKMDEIRRDVRLTRDFQFSTVRT